ncbi:MAG TPA: hypothetical protein VHC95_11095, partial [Opitutales bacterium]|nr:hypothetical protein [Opitutales bacterium]
PAKPPPNFVLVINVTPPGPGKAGDNLHFEIGVASRTGKFPADAVGTLEVFDPEERILTSDVQAETDGKVLIYTFDLSPRYLGKSRFSFKGTGADAAGKPAADVLWVTLKDYVNKSLQ